MERCASASTQTDVDESILDYLTYTAIKALLADWGARREDGGSTQQTANSSLHLQTVECGFQHPTANIVLINDQRSSNCFAPCILATELPLTFDSVYNF